MVRAIVGVAWIVGGETVVAKVDAEGAVGENGIAGNVDARNGIVFGVDAVANVKGDQIRIAGVGAADGGRGRSRKNAIGAVRQRCHAVRRNADDVAAHEVRTVAAGRARDVDAFLGIA